MWRLRLLDSHGKEVGGATLDPHDYWVADSHPDADYVEMLLDTLGDEFEMTTFTEWDEDIQNHIIGTAYRRITESPKERLLGCAGSLVAEGRVAGYELNKG